MIKQAVSRRSLFLAIYGIAWKLLLPTVATLNRLGILPRDWRVAERFGVLRSAGGATPDTIWLHCASLGEAKGLWALVRTLVSEEDCSVITPSPLRILVTSNTFTGLDFLKRECALLPTETIVGAPEVHASIAPFDHPTIVKRFITAQNVRIIGLYEAEIWPHYIQVSAKQNIPVLLVSARMSTSAHSLYRKFPGARARLLTRINWIQTQSENERLRLENLGAGALSTGFDLKAAHYLRTYRQASLRTISVPQTDGNPSARNRLAMVSLHIQEFHQLLPELPTLLDKFNIAIFPRHLKELPHFRRSLEAFWKSHGFAMHSSDPQARNVLVDSMGQVEGILPSCRLAFVGGSLIPIGCHNLWEPVLAGLKTYFGPWCGNQESLAKLLVERGIAEVVDKVAQLRMWSEPGPEVEEACRLLVEESREALNGALSECRERIFVTLQSRSGYSVAADHSRGKAP